MSQQFRLTGILLLCLATLPACLVGLLITKYSLDFPWSDEWVVASLLAKYAQGALTFDDLFAQQYEYRQFFPNLLAVGLGWLTGWDVRYQMLVSFVLACLTSFNIYQLGKWTLNCDNTCRLLVFFAANLLIFSPVQYENWLMGQQVIYFVPIACITTCLLIAYSTLSVTTKFTLCMCLATVSTFSSANGILCWVVVLPVLVWSKTWRNFTRMKWPATMWMIGLLLNATLYFYDYQPQHNSSLYEILAKPAHVIVYFLAFLGSPLSGDHRYLVLAAAVIGLGVAALFVWSCRCFVEALPNFALTSRMICWLMIGAYSVITAVLVTCGRLSLGIQFSVTSRYKTFSLYLIVCLIHLLAIIFTTQRKDFFFSKWFYSRRLLMVGAAAFAVLYLVACTIAIRHMGMLRTGLLQAKAGMLFMNIIDDNYLPEKTEKLCPHLLAMRDTVNALEALGFPRPRLIKSRRVQDIGGTGALSSDSYGEFGQLTSKDDVYVASGHALLPNRGEPADAVLLAYDDANGDSTAFALAEMSNEGDILRRLRNGNADADSYWQDSFSTKALPAEAVKITAWAFDANTGKAYKLDGAHVIQKSYRTEAAAN